MYRFKIYLQDYSLTSSEFDNLESCEAEFYYQLMVLKGRGGGLEQFISGIGWVVHE